MHFIFLFLTQLLCTFFLYGQEESIKRSSTGENWKIISRGSLGSGAHGYTITNPGNYTLSENLTPFSGSGTTIINIDSDDVVLDLAGHTLNGTNTLGKGIFINGKKNITVKNGHCDAIKNNSIHIGTGAKNIRIEHITITNPGNAPEVQIDASSIFFNNLIISAGGSVGNCINLANNLNDLIFDTIRISHISGRAISLGTGCYNVRLKNIEIDTCLGTNNGIFLGASCYDIIIEKFRMSNLSSDALFIGNSCYGIILNNGTITNVTGSGISIGSDTHGIKLSRITLTGCINGITSLGTNGGLIERCSIFRTRGTNAAACKLTSCQNIAIEKSRFFETISTGSIAFGLWLTSCTNIDCSNVQSGGHTGTQSIAFKLETNCFGCNFKNCIARSDYATSTTALQGSSGFHLTACKGCTFTDCLSTSHQGATLSCGYYLNNCSGNTFTDCKALQNTIITGGATALAAGFYSLNGTGNSFNNCQSIGQHAGTTSSTTGYGASGFYFSNEAQSALFECKAIGNGASFGHTANAFGFYFDALLNDPCTFIEVRKCAASSNCTSATTGTTAYGFYDTAPATSNVFIDCYAACNSDNAPVRIVTNYAANLPIGGTNPHNFPRVEAGIDGLLDIANKPLFYNVSITS